MVQFYRAGQVEGSQGLGALGVDQVEGSQVPLQGILGSAPSSLSLLPGCHEVSGFAPTNKFHHGFLP
jgi:hypothetical protein